MNIIKSIPSDGLNIVAESFGSGPPLVFAHGLTSNRHVIRRQLTGLAHRYQIVIYDQRGHNQSSPVHDPDLYDVDRMAADMGAVMDAFGIKKAVVGGESMGAATTMNFALRWPQRVEKLLITAPAFSDQPNPETEMLYAMGEAIEKSGLDGFLEVAEARWRDEFGWSDEVIKLVREMQGSHDAMSLATACKTVVNWKPFQDLQSFASLTMPVCIIAWPEDSLHPIALAQRLAGIFPNARLETIPTLPFAFVNAQKLGQIYANFLSEPT